MGWWACVQRGESARGAAPRDQCLTPPPSAPLPAPPLSQHEAGRRQARARGGRPGERRERGGRRRRAWRRGRIVRPAGAEGAQIAARGRALVPTIRLTTLRPAVPRAWRCAPHAHRLCACPRPFARATRAKGLASAPRSRCAESGGGSGPTATLARVPRLRTAPPASRRRGGGLRSSEATRVSAPAVFLTRSLLLSPPPEPGLGRVAQAGRGGALARRGEVHGRRHGGGGVRRVRL